MDTSIGNEENMKFAIILGTRPEIIKMSPIIREFEQSGLDYFILHTGQHYSYEMDRVFFEQLELPDAKYNLDVGSGTHGKQTGKILTGIEQVLMQEMPETVKGGANVLAGTEPEKIVRCAKHMIERERNWVNPFGDGMSGEKIRRVVALGGAV